MNLGANERYQTPLYNAVCCADKKAAFLGAKTLIRLGADINLASSGLVETKNDTPLYQAAHKSGNVLLVALLLRHNAIVTDDYSVQGQQMIGLAKAELAKRKEGFVKAALKDKGALFQRLPADILRVIFDLM